LCGVIEANTGHAVLGEGSRCTAVLGQVKGELQRKRNIWSNYTLVHSQPFSEICFHDYRM